MEKSFLLGVGITHSTEDKIVAYVINSVQKKQENYYIVTPNPEMIVFANHDERFKTILNQARIALADGVGLLWGSKFLGHPLKARVSGTDFVDVLCKKIAEKPLTVGFLGGREGVAEETAKCLQKKYPGLQVLFASDEWGSKLHRSPKLLKQPIDVLFIAFGFPKQEEWMASHVGKVPVKVMIGVGGAFDYISGRVPRAPVWVRQLGFEWFFRLIVQPWRLKRQLSLIEFMLLILKEKAKMLIAIRLG